MLWLLSVAVVGMPSGAWAQFGRHNSGDAEKPKDETNFEKLEAPKGAKKISPKHSIWVDPEKKEVLVDGRICMRNGVLELFACLEKTKEHESIVALDTQAFLVHTALLQLGAKEGKPVQFEPEYRAATGNEVEVEVMWKGKDGKMKTASAQDWILDMRTKKPMEGNWVFAGSGFWKDPEGKEHYMAEGGEVICVSNFPTALLDLPIKSPEANAELFFFTNTEEIPELGTPVRVIIRPKTAKPTRPEPKKEAETKAAE